MIKIKAKKLAKVWNGMGDKKKQVGSIQPGEFAFAVAFVGSYVQLYSPVAGYSKMEWFDFEPTTVPQAQLYTPPNPPEVLPDNVFRVRRWGDPILVKEADRSTSIIKSTNFQAIGLYNKLTGFGGVTNYLWIPRGDIDRLANLQVEDSYDAKVADWRDQKMRWLVKPKGTIYFSGDIPGEWQTLPKVKWGTIALGWNFVTVEDTETLTVKTPDGVKRKREMARIVAFRSADWQRPLEELYLSGLVHICYCAYGKDNIGYSPKGIVFSPLWSPVDWDFAGNDKPDAFYLPMDWLVKDSSPYPPQ